MGSAPGRGWLILLLVVTSPGIQAGVPVDPGLSLARYPELLAIPGFPVYYAPQIRANYFFHQGWYWVFAEDRWFRAAWYNGPWQRVLPDRVPLFILRIPVGYYGQAPDWFGARSLDAPPHWTARWGEAWARRHIGWDQWNRKSVRAIAPLPTYQKKYSGADYPQAKAQYLLQMRNYPTLADGLANGR